MPIEDLGLSTRARTTLLRHGVRTTAALLAMTDEQVLSVRNFGGRREVLEMKSRLAALGYLDAAAVRRQWDAFWNEPL